MKILITGANGFVGKNLLAHLAERKDVQALSFTRESPLETLAEAVGQADFVFHLAGVNRPKDVAEFTEGNVGLTGALCEALREVAKATGRKVPVLYTSSIQAGRDNPYGTSKLEAERLLQAWQADSGAPVYLYRLPNVFGKWCKPNYNSAVATFCHNIARGLPVQVNDPAAPVSLVYVDDVVDSFMQAMRGELAPGACQVAPQYSATVGELVERIEGFRASRGSLVTDRVGTGLVRALYSTYLSYLPPEGFAYGVPKYGDARGVFVEVLKTPDCGQFSYFTAHPGITRGGHYHHSKTEKFLVIKGKARFGFRHILSGETSEILTSGETPTIVETVPGWSHDITNVGEDEMLVVLWANEIFDRQRPDTFSHKV
ncbi:UDP-2-acetamido-2,6-beta-L-arabino-hexul-4-ose reductase [compost metagenome]